MIQLPDQFRVPIINHLTSEKYFLIPAKAIEITPGRITEVVSICQQPAVYNNLFREIFSDVPYNPDHARDWLERAHKGWNEGTHFVFCIVTSDNCLAAACELSSDQANDAEVGYWASGEHRGIMTNAVLEIIRLAGAAGYRSFMASALHGNHPSKAVLKRCGFQEESGKRDDTYDYFNLLLPLKKGK